MNEVYARRRRGGFMVVALIVGAIWIGSGAMADAEPQPAATTFHTFSAGESLWTVAAEIATPSQDVRDVVAALMERNGLISSQVQVGQTIAVPVRAR